MELKTQVVAEEGKQDLRIHRVFDLPLELLFLAFTEAPLLEQWMGTKVIKLENKPHGSWAFETIDPKGNRYGFNGVIHSFIPEKEIIRTFEMEGMLMGVQLEFLYFEALSDTTSQLTMHTIYKSVEERDKVVQRGMVKGINMAHDRLQKVLQQ
ncbi:MAG TPA: SRPBCC domain-containing protein [Chitinophagaceae bacterium]|nr:SRPBCC domain-containing protein [Chitinophagaceae bacterium]